MSNLRRHMDAKRIGLKPFLSRNLCRLGKVDGTPQACVAGLGGGTMCGIAGAVDLAGNRLLSGETLHAMADAILHRGPDEDGYFQADGISLANRRLSIVGLFDGKQPIS